MPPELKEKAAVVWYSELGIDLWHDPGTYAKRILAEGDSWFSLNAMPGTNMLESLCFKQKPIIVNCAMPGDTIRHIREMKDDMAFQREIEGGIVYDVILLSIGGNDVIDDAGKIIPTQKRPQPVRANPDEYCDVAHFNDTLDKIMAGYRAMFALRDGPMSKCKNTPIVIHTYDKATPRESPALLGRFAKLRGPWLQKALSSAWVPKSQWNAVSDYILGSLGDRLLTLDDPAKRIHVIETRDTLIRADPKEKGDSNDWLNEIHPNRGGYAKLSEKISPVLAQWI